ncbi:hypothetical protein MASR2M50_24180 [Thauera sp.]
MGILLAFMFLVNVLGAIFLLPALACWLGIGREKPADAQKRAAPGGKAPHTGLMRSAEPAAAAQPQRS